MKIETSSIGLAAAARHEIAVSQSVTTKLELPKAAKVDKQAISASYVKQTSNANVAENGVVKDVAAHSQEIGDAAMLDLSAEAQESSVKDAQNAAIKAAATPKTLPSFELSPEDDLKLQMIKQILSALRGGKQMKFGIMDRHSVSYDKMNMWETASKLTGKKGPTITLTFQAGGAQEAPKAFRTTTQESSYRETESMSFIAQGMVKTSDGKTIGIDMSLLMSRDFYTANIASERSEVSMCDPLVLNFEGGSAELSQTKFSFDIDCDGSLDQISFVKEGSGMLALDKNGDGKINDGSELFGTTSGDGFADLAVYDEDANGWIDENDSIYDSLRIWSKNADGSDSLVALGAKGVGAIYLGSAKADYSIKGADNSVYGAVRSTGIYLNEDGTSGTIQHIDIAL